MLPALWIAGRAPTSRWGELSGTWYPGTTDTCVLAKASWGREAAQGENSPSTGKALVIKPHSWKEDVLEAPESSHLCPTP